MRMKDMKKEHTIYVDGEAFTYHKIGHDINGNPRYVLHFLELGVKPEDYGNIPGLSRYRANWFGGGYVFQSYNLEETIKRALDVVARYYSNKGGL